MTNQENVTLYKQIETKQKEIDALYETYMRDEFHREFFTDFEAEFPNLKDQIQQIEFDTEAVYDDGSSFDTYIETIQFQHVNGDAFSEGEDPTLEGYTLAELSVFVSEFLYGKNIDIVTKHTYEILNKQIAKDNNT